MLADVLDVAVKNGVDHVVDFATLTGACLVALGLDCAGLFTNDQDLCDQFKSAADEVGEDSWQMPMTPNFGESKSKATWPISRIWGSGRWGGAITAAKFLEEFVADTPWLHVDDCRACMVRQCKKMGSTAADKVCFVRTLVKLAKQYGK